MLVIILLFRLYALHQKGIVMKERERYVRILVNEVHMPQSMCMRLWISADICLIQHCTCVNWRQTSENDSLAYISCFNSLVPSISRSLLSIPLFNCQVCEMYTSHQHFCAPMFLRTQSTIDVMKRLHSTAVAVVVVIDELCVDIQNGTEPHSRVHKHTQTYTYVHIHDEGVQRNSNYFEWVRLPMQKIDRVYSSKRRRNM